MMLMTLMTLKNYVGWDSQLFLQHPKAPGARREISDGEEGIPGLRVTGPQSESIRTWMASHFTGLFVHVS